MTANGKPQVNPEPAGGVGVPLMLDYAVIRAAERGELPRTRMESARSAVFELIEAAGVAEAALSDIGDADREPGDDVAWLEARAAKALPRLRAALAACQRQGKPE